MLRDVFFLWALLGFAAWTQPTACAQSGDSKQKRHSLALANDHHVAHHQLARCKVYVLDVSQDIADSPRCDVAARAESKSGAVFRKDDPRFVGDPDVHEHFHSQHSGAYWLNRTLSRSRYLAASLEEADAVFVFDYCYQMWYLAEMHAGASYDEPVAAIGKAYEAIGESEHFKRNPKAYGFYYPHPMSGIQSSAYLCNAMAQSLQIVVEGPRVYICPSDEAKVNRLVVPYSSPMFIMDWEVTGRLEKDIFAFFLGSCSRSPDALIGKRMRPLLEDHLEPALAERGLTSFIKCSAQLAHKEVRDLMRRSRFCLLVPGDTQSSRRLTDIILAGCIPVFLGPPWHSMPLAAYVHYKSLGIYIHVQEYVQLLGVMPLDELPPGQFSNSPFNPIWWIPDENISSVVLSVESVADVADVLLTMTEEAIDAKQQAVVAAHDWFLYRRQPGEEFGSKPNAVDAIVDRLCRQAVLE